jgi:N-acetylmuramic acid 6-phosphate etherase
MTSPSIDLDRLATEQRNPHTLQIDRLSTLEMVTLINAEDQQVARAVEQALPQIAEAIDRIAIQLRQAHLHGSWH